MLRDEIASATFLWLQAARFSSPVPGDDFTIRSVTKLAAMSESEGETVVISLVKANMVKLARDDFATLTPDGREWIDRLIVEEQVAREVNLATGGGDRLSPSL